VPEDPADVLDALGSAEDAFGGATERRPEYETGLDPSATDSPVIQLRKACRLLDACRTLRANDGYHTSVIEMSFAAVERSLEFYALTASNDSVGDFQDHQRVYERAAALNVLSEETAARLETLYTGNRSAAYYRDTAATRGQAEAMFALADRIHRHVREFAHSSHECRCRDMTEE
jgi:hypothetical protein